MPQPTPETDLVLVADDDRLQRVLLERWLGEAGYTVRSFADGAACLAELERSLPSAICLDVAMPGLDGLATLEEIRRRDRALPVLILSGDGSVEKVVTAIQLGAFDYLVKPVDKGRLTTAMRNAIERFQLTLRVAELERETREEAAGRGILGRSPVMKRLLRQIDRVAASDITVLIHGESGSGKELVARALHEASTRRSGPLVAVNCAAIPETLQESELFGHERGAFTGAVDRRKGKIELADRGTLFLDEVGEIAPTLQAKLLRVIQERRFHRVGGSVEVRSDFRLVTATHRDLAAEVAAGRFREDLFFRLAVFELEVPALRERGDDVLLLARKFLKDAAESSGQPGMELAPEAAEALLAYSFPGNVRELGNAIERALVAAEGGRIELADLPRRMLPGHAEKAGATRQATAVSVETTPAPPLVPAPPEPPVAPDPTARLTLAELERQAITAAVGRSAGNLSRAARELGIDRSTLYRKLRQLGADGTYSATTETTNVPE